MIIVDAESRAKAVLISIQGKSPEIQLKVITGAIRGATEQAAQIVEQEQLDLDPEFEPVRVIGKRIADAIRATA